VFDALVLAFIGFTGFRVYHCRLHRKAQCTAHSLLDLVSGQVEYGVPHHGVGGHAGVTGVVVEFVSRFLFCFLSRESFDVLGYIAGAATGSGTDYFNLLYEAVRFNFQLGLSKLFRKFIDVGVTYWFQ